MVYFIAKSKTKCNLIVCDCCLNPFYTALPATASQRRIQIEKKNPKIHSCRETNKHLLYSFCFSQHIFFASMTVCCVYTKCTQWFVIAAGKLLPFAYSSWYAVYMLLYICDFFSLSFNFMLSIMITIKWNYTWCGVLCSVHLFVYRSANCAYIMWL